MLAVYLLKVILVVMIFLDMASINYRPARKSTAETVMTSETVEKSRVGH